ncbi:hypothetical protein BDU57DRAFT_184954 [Ampelomyces quisqualis]|uniref:Uncharacterized protein n=1 Tax=Ampelomyces quisqualis TaxID=50730 RepID=A0A6A5QW10_AMPQU|nr:hypothetical protein BDU57DRAFT_184954 [Ampelomyces quisqualis]
MGARYYHVAADREMCVCLIGSYWLSIYYLMASSVRLCGREDTYGVDVWHTSVEIKTSISIPRSAVTPNRSINQPPQRQLPKGPSKMFLLMALVQSVLGGVTDFFIGFERMRSSPIQFTSAFPFSAKSCKTGCRPR